MHSCSGRRSTKFLRALITNRLLTPHFVTFPDFRGIGGTARGISRTAARVLRPARRWLRPPIFSHALLANKESLNPFSAEFVPMNEVDEAIELLGDFAPVEFSAQTSRTEDTRTFVNVEFDYRSMLVAKGSAFRWDIDGFSSPFPMIPHPRLRRCLECRGLRIHPPRDTGRRS